MPIRKLPTKIEKQAANELQTPKQIANELRPPKQEAPKMRSLASAGIDGEQKQYVKTTALFASDDDTATAPVVFHTARLKPNPFEPGKNLVSITMQFLGESERFVVDFSENDARMEYVVYFHTNTIPLGPIQIVKILDVEGKLRFYKFEAVEGEVIPF